MLRVASAGDLSSHQLSRLQQCRCTFSLQATMQLLTRVMCWPALMATFSRLPLHRGEDLLVMPNP